MIGYFDGASRGNPGHAGAGAYITDGLEAVWECSEYLGFRTNNEAEYEALLFLLREVRVRGLRKIEIRGDSKLVVCQIHREWKINMPHLRKLAAEAWRLTEDMSVTLTWVPRSENSIADALSNKAIDDHIQGLGRAMGATLKPVQNR